MLPRWHIFFGAIFTFLLWVIMPNTWWVYLLLVFLSAFLIDFDHYMVAVRKNKTINFFKALQYHVKAGKIQENEKKRGIRRKGDFHIFHTIEFHFLVGLLGLVWIGFFYIFIGMVFHSLLDIYALVRDDYMYRREFVFFNWAKRKF